MAAVNVTGIHAEINEVKERDLEAYETIPDVITSDKFLLKLNGGTTYLPSTWYAIHDDMRDVDNWRLLSEEETILPPTEE